MLGDIQKEIEHEERTDSIAQAERLKALLDDSASGRVDLPRAQVLVSRLFDDVRAHIEAVCAVQTRGIGGKYKSWLRAIPSEVAALIAIRTCIELCTSSTHKTRVHVQDLASYIGRLYELEARIQQAEKVNPMYMQKIHDQIRENGTTQKRHIRKVYGFAIQQVLKGELEFDLTKTEIIHIGKFGVDACHDCGLIVQSRGKCSSGVAVEYVLHPEIYEFLHSYDKNDVRNVVSKADMRMYCPPEPWTNTHDGGYITARRKAAAPLFNIRDIVKSERARVAQEFTAEKMPIVFEAGNYMQGIAFNIHAPTRDAINRVWLAGGGVLGVPERTAPVRPDFPFGEDWVRAEASEDELEVFARWKILAARHHAELRKWRGKVREIGGFFKSSGDVDDPLWFPMYFDKRGRWYYRGTPNPQGSDLAKAVLHFHEKKPLGADGLYWLKVHIANSFGFDKERFDDRARWTDQHWADIERALDEPENHPDVWGTDAPWCMYSAAWELREALRSPDPAQYRTGIPIHMDATCSGLQHFSAILRDPIGGQCVNLTDEAGCGPKQDIYAKVAQNALAAIKLDLEGVDAQTVEIARWWLSAGIPRGLAKKPVMTYVYGATLLNTSTYIREYVECDMGLKFPEGIKPNDMSMYAARKLFQGIEATVPAAAAAMRWLRSVAKQMPNGKRMEWRTPTGFLVQHDYRSRADTRIKLNSCGLTHIIVRDSTEDTDPMKMQNSISPNYVHALDSSHLTLTAHKMRAANVSMVAIHDSFGTHPCDVAIMHRNIREAFVELYANRNILGEFLWDVDGIGEPPNRGSLDLNAVLDSEFFFC